MIYPGVLLVSLLRTFQKYCKAAPIGAALNDGVSGGSQSPTDAYGLQLADFLQYRFRHFYFLGSGRSERQTCGAEFDPCYQLNGGT